jgi:hypothetical protein
MTLLDTLELFKFPGCLFEKVHFQGLIITLAIFMVQKMLSY